MAVYRNGTKVVRCFANNPLLHRQLVSASRLIEIFGVVDFSPRPLFLYWSHRVRSWIGAWQWWSFPPSRHTLLRLAAVLLFAPFLFDCKKGDPSETIHNQEIFSFFLILSPTLSLQSFPTGFRADSPEHAWRWWGLQIHRARSQVWRSAQHQLAGDRLSFPGETELVELLSEEQLDDWAKLNKERKDKEAPIYNLLYRGTLAEEASRTTKTRNQGRIETNDPFVKKSRHCLHTQDHHQDLIRSLSRLIGCVNTVPFDDIWPGSPASGH